MTTERQKALKQLKADCKRYDINLREYNQVDIRQWVDDILLDWLIDYNHEIQIYGAPYHLAKPS